jgi:hypothetical protein
MKDIGTRIKVVTTAVFSAVALAALAPGSVAAGGGLWFWVFVGDPCVSIAGAAPNSAVKFVIRDASGARLVRENLTADSNGNALYCAGFRVAAGHTLKAESSTDEHSLTVPELSIALNRVTDRLKGTGPEDATLKIRCVRPDPFRHFEPCIWTRRVTTGRDGTWATSVPFDFIGGAEFSVQWRSGDDRVGAWGTAPFISVTLDRSSFHGATRPGEVRLIELEGKASTAVLGDPFDGTFSDHFRDGSDEQVNVAPGDSLSADIAPDASWIVPDIDATASASTDVVSGRCYDTGASRQLVNVLLYRYGNEQGWALVHTEPDGSFSFDFRYGDGDVWTNVNVKSGDRLVVRCMQAEGDWVQRVIFASA